jgi:hypothetical protein
MRSLGRLAVDENLAAAEVREHRKIAGQRMNVARNRRLQPGGIDDGKRNPIPDVRRRFTDGRNDEGP